MAHQLAPISNSIWILEDRRCLYLDYKSNEPGLSKKGHCHAWLGALYNLEMYMGEVHFVGANIHGGNDSETIDTPLVTQFGIQNYITKGVSKIYRYLNETINMKFRKIRCFFLTENMSFY